MWSTAPPPSPLFTVTKHSCMVSAEPGVFLPASRHHRARLHPLPVGSLNTALASACVWMICLRSTAMLGTLFCVSCFRAACSEEEKKHLIYRMLAFNASLPCSKEFLSHFGLLLSGMWTLSCKVKLPAEETHSFLTWTKWSLDCSREESSN